MTQDKKFTAEESSETDIKKDSDVRTCIKTADKIKKQRDKTR